MVERSLGVGFAPQAHFQRRSHAYVPNSSRGVRRCVRGGARGDSGCRAHQSGVRLRFRHARRARLGGPRQPRGGAESQQQGPPRRGIAGAAHRPAAGGRRSAAEGHWCRPTVRCDPDMRCRAVGWMCTRPVRSRQAWTALHAGLVSRRGSCDCDGGVPSIRCAIAMRWHDGGRCRAIASRQPAHLGTRLGALLGNGTTKKHLQVAQNLNLLGAALLLLVGAVLLLLLALALALRGLLAELLDVLLAQLLLLLAQLLLLLALLLGL